ncbi:hypothetical protein OsJ_09520 [Oryza sativa Japonica Group]|uniref:Uncharacterized protein n=1 Tax=Oryza sativa subsp. japonica TaxID=39947 RepID=B9FBH1_ORYSJ|nr:hypothetical protein OsJ_09520 [Oryza sativa Japonica Group]
MDARWPAGRRRAGAPVAGKASYGGYQVAPEPPPGPWWQSLPTGADPPLSTCKMSSPATPPWPCNQLPNSPSSSLAAMIALQHCISSTATSTTLTIAADDEAMIEFSCSYYNTVLTRFVSEMADKNYSRAGCLLELKWLKN